MKNGLISFVEKRERHRWDGGPETASFHSRSYHRYFEGYTEVMRLQPNGRRRIERIYTGVYHRQSLTGKQRAALRVLYALLWLLSAACFLLGAAQNVGSNTAWYVTLPEMVSVAALFWVLCTLVNYMTAPSALTVHEFRTTSTSLKRSSIIAAAAIAATAATTTVYALLHLHKDLGAELFCVLMALAAAAMMLLAFTIERRVPYQLFPSEHEAPQEGAEIN